MLYLYKKKDDPLGQRISEFLEEFSLACKTEIVNTGESYLKDNEQIFKGEKAIFEHLDKYKKFVQYQHSISSDACYLDPDTGEVC